MGVGRWHSRNLISRDLHCGVKSEPKLFLQQDTNSDGQWSYDEIVALRSGIYLLNPNGSVDDAFIVLDQDHNNRIDKGGIAVGIQTIYLLSCIQQRIGFIEIIFPMLRQMPTIGSWIQGLLDEHAL